MRPANYGRWRRGEVGTNGRNQKKNSILSMRWFFEGLLTNKVRAMYKSHESKRIISIYSIATLSVRERVAGSDFEGLSKGFSHPEVIGLLARHRPFEPFFERIMQCSFLFPNSPAI